MSRNNHESVYSTCSRVVSLRAMSVRRDPSHLAISCFQLLTRLVGATTTLTCTYVRARVLARFAARMHGQISLWLGAHRITNASQTDRCHWRLDATTCTSAWLTAEFSPNPCDVKHCIAYDLGITKTCLNKGHQTHGHVILGEAT